jgi:hypothetical protein
MWKRAVGAVVALIGLVAAIIEIADAWPESWPTVRDAAEAIYPLGVIAALALTAIGAIAWAVFGRDSYSEEKKTHDGQIVTEIRDLIPRRSVEFVRDHDFGAVWRGESMDRFYDLEHLNDVEHKAFAADLRRAIEKLFEANHTFTLKLAEYSAPSHGRADLFDLGPIKYDREHRHVWETRRSELNDASVNLADAYDDFIEVARRRSLLRSGETVR